MIFDYSVTRFSGKCFISVIMGILFFSQILCGENIYNSLNTVIVDEIDFNEAQIQDVVKYLKKKSNGRVNFILNSEGVDISTPITLQLTDVTVGDAVKYVCMTGRMKYKVTSIAVVIGANLNRFSGPELPDNAGTAGTEISQKIDSMLFPSIDLQNESVDTVLAYFRFFSKNYDPNKKGINIVFAASEEEKKKLPKLTLALNKILFRDAIIYVCNGANLDFRIEQNAVVIFPKKVKQKKDK